MNTDTNPRSRWQLTLVALVFAVPMVAAYWMYFVDGSIRPEGRTNHGTLLEQIVNLPDELPGSPLVGAIEDHWAMVYLQSGGCEMECQDALYKQRQTRLMLGNDMSRVLRVLLHGSALPDTLFLAQEHVGLITLQDSAARQLLIDMRPRGTATDGYYLVDPLGNLIMYFSTDIEPRDLVDDVEHLLKLSRIG